MIADGLSTHPLADCSGSKLNGFSFPYLYGSKGYFYLSENNTGVQQNYSCGIIKCYFKKPFKYGSLYGCYYPDGIEFFEKNYREIIFNYRDELFLVSD